MGARFSSPKPAPHWKPDSEAPSCEACGADFTTFTRRHHCRACGGLYCAKCSVARVPLPAQELERPQRVCTLCVADPSRLTQHTNAGSDRASVPSGMDGSIFRRSTEQTADRSMLDDRRTEDGGMMRASEADDEPSPLRGAGHAGSSHDDAYADPQATATGDGLSEPERRWRKNEEIRKLKARRRSRTSRNGSVASSGTLGSTASLASFFDSSNMSVPSSPPASRADGGYGIFSDSAMYEDQSAGGGGAGAPVSLAISSNAPKDLIPKQSPIVARRAASMEEVVEETPSTEELPLPPFPPPAPKAAAAAPPPAERNPKEEYVRRSRATSASEDDNMTFAEERISFDAEKRSAVPLPIS